MSPAKAWLAGAAVVAGAGAGALAAAGVASADTDATPPARADAARTAQAHAPATPRRHPQRRAAQTSPGRSVSVALPQLPLRDGLSFTVSDDVIAGRAADYLAAGGDAADAPRFFFGDLAVASLESLAATGVDAGQVRRELGSLTASGYFGGVWLRDNLRDTGAPATAGGAGPVDLTVSAIGTGLFDVASAGLLTAAGPADWLVRGAAHASIPVLLALYGYNRGYLEVLLENPPAGVTPAPGSLGCGGFLDCNSSAFPLEIATRYDAALGKLADPPSLPWWEMSAWTALLESATGAGRFVWETIASQGSFSPASYQALVELSSAYLMVSKAAVLSSMLAYADGDAALGRSALRLQAGLWMWSGSYFAGLASNAPAGTEPAIVVNDA